MIHVCSMRSFHIKYDENFDTVKDIEIQEEWKIMAGSMSQRYIKSSTINRSNVHPITSINRDGKFYDFPQLPEPKRVKFTFSNETDDKKRSSD